MDGSCVDGCNDTKKSGSYCNLTGSAMHPWCDTCDVTDANQQSVANCSAGCEVCVPPCLKCINGYFLSGVTCVPCNNNDQHCELCFGNRNCTKCNKGYYGPVCKKCPTNCIDCVSVLNCTRCKVGWQRTKCHCRSNNNTFCGVNVCGKVLKKCVYECSIRCRADTCQNIKGYC